MTDLKWFIDPEDPFCIAEKVEDGTTQSVVQVYSRTHDGLNIARLVLAAPAMTAEITRLRAEREEMVEVLGEMLEVHIANHNHPQHVAVRALIARARGGE